MTPELVTVPMDALRAKADPLTIANWGPVIVPLLVSVVIVPLLKMPEALLLLMVPLLVSAVIVPVLLIPFDMPLIDPLLVSVVIVKSLEIPKAMLLLPMMVPLLVSVPIEPLL